MSENETNITDTTDAADDEAKIDVPAGPKKVMYQLSNPTIQALYDMYKEEDLVLEPEFQRNFVWDKPKASKLIESILLNIPLPLIYTAEVNGKEEVIDGHQRLTSIFAFLDGHWPPGKTTPFKLSKNLKLLSEEIGDRTFAELNEKYQKEIKRRGLQVIRISEASQGDIKFEMFERLNTNIKPLTAQELRNCLYRGRYNDFLKRLATYKDYRYILNQANISQRMLHVEYVLMFCAFYHSPWERYGTSLKQMLNHEMVQHKEITDTELEDLESQFKKSVHLVKDIWDKNGFHIFSVDRDTKRHKWAKILNQGLFQILMHWFTKFEQRQVIGCIDLIREELLNLQSHDKNFIGTLTGSGTNSPRAVCRKFETWGKTLAGILDYPTNEPRAFSYQLKMSLFEKDQTCQLCDERIEHIDDSVVDDIICYWRGRKTIPTNARLTHRHCLRVGNE